MCKQFGLPAAAVWHRGRERDTVRVRRVTAWLGRDLGGLTMAKSAPLRLAMTEKLAAGQMVPFPTVWLLMAKGAPSFLKETLVSCWL